MAAFSFDASNVPQRQSREVMPSQWYLAAITESEVGAGGSPGSVVVKVEYTIQAPPEFRGRKVFDNINSKNQNATAERIGNETISSINHAVGRIRINDTNDWHGIPLAIKLGVERATMDPDNPEVEKYPAKNKVNDIKPASHYKGDTGAAAGPQFADYQTQANFQQPSLGLQSPAMASFPQAANASLPPGYQQAPQAPAQPAWPSAPVQNTATPPAPPVAVVQAAPVLSPDGAWKLVNGAWVANTPPPPAPPTAPAVAGTTPWPGGAAPAAGPWAQG